MLLPVVLLVSFLGLVDGVDRSKFQTCDTIGFCRRNRRLSNPEATHQGLDVKVVVETLRIGTDSLSVELDAGEGRFLIMEVTGVVNGVLRIHFKEKNSLQKRYEVVDSLIPFEASKIVYKPKRQSVTVGKGNATSSLVLQFEPFVLNYYNGRGEHVVALNSRQFLNWEFYRSRPAEIQNDLDSEWDEKFGTHEDKKPHGPSAVSLDAAFLEVDHVYGIPTHATNLSLPATRGAEGKRYDQPFRLYNLDVFE